jgi:AraC-like DNA-binding protein
MSIVFEERAADSPFVEKVTHGHTLSAGVAIRPAESHWHLVVTRFNGGARAIIVGPWSTAGHVRYGAGAEVLWIQFKLGTFLPHHPFRAFRDVESVLPEGSRRGSFWMRNAAWQLPDYEHVEPFVARLARDEVLAHDAVVSAALKEQSHELAARTVRERFLRATGQSYGHIRQLERAQKAAALLRQGVSIADAMGESGYFDQPHMTRSLKRFIGHTPAQLARASAKIRHSVQDRA